MLPARNPWQSGQLETGRPEERNTLQAPQAGPTRTAPATQRNSTSTTLSSTADCRLNWRFEVGVLLTENGDLTEAEGADSMGPDASTNGFAKDTEGLHCDAVVREVELGSEARVVGPEDEAGAAATAAAGGADDDEDLVLTDAGVEGEAGCAASRYKLVGAVEFDGGADEVGAEGAIGVGVECAEGQGGTDDGPVLGDATGEREIGCDRCCGGRGVPAGGAAIDSTKNARRDSTCEGTE